MKSLTKNHYVFNKDAFVGIEKLLFHHGFVINDMKNGYVRPETGCYFTFMDINKYQTVSDFQIDFPYYAIT